MTDISIHSDCDSTPGTDTRHNAERTAPLSSLSLCHSLSVTLSATLSTPFPAVAILMSKALIISAVKTLDTVGSLQHCLALEQQIEQLGVEILQLQIDPLSTDWHSPEAPLHFRSGCAPIEAAAHAKALIDQGQQAVLICGEDKLKTDYSRQQRLENMEVYGADLPVTQAYTDLSQHFLAQHQLDEPGFRDIAQALFENYSLSYRDALGDDFALEQLPDARWYQPITSLFRGVDCANPLIDFKGRLLIVSESLARQLKCAPEQMLELHAVGLGRLPHDGPEHIEMIARYDHLRDAYQQCCLDSGVDFAEVFKRGEALLEVYTCFPVVPMAFLLTSGLVETVQQIPEFLTRHRITVTGGMNLARAPWNNPALNALISMHHDLLNGEQQHGMVHGNGGLGYRQGVALLSKVAPQP
ncbi:MAG: hypothetical protein ACI9W6_002684 [Motiliproteus sp.]|jgi:hypothetical protein